MFAILTSILLFPSLITTLLFEERKNNLFEFLEHLIGARYKEEGRGGGHYLELELQLTFSLP